MKTSDEIVLEFTESQQKEIIQKCGFNPKALKMSVLSLIKFSLLATAAGSAALPLARDVLTANAFFKPRENDHNCENPFFIKINLTCEQCNLIESIVSKEWNSILFFPDEHKITYSENFRLQPAIQRIGQSFVIVTQNSGYLPSSNDKLILLPAEDSDTFGRGSHPTTQCVIKMTEKYIKSGDNVLDVGTGSGILAVAAARLDAKAVLGIDSDPFAVRLARKTVVANGLTDKIIVKEGIINSVEGSFTKIIANIFSPIIIKLAIEFHNKMESRGNLIVSGITQFRSDEVVAKLERVGFKHRETTCLQNWAAIVFEK